MTIYRKYAPTEVEAMAESLNQQLSDGILPEDLLERFKFRGAEGKTWTVIPQSGAWYCHRSGDWQKAEAPDTSLDGPNDLLDTVALPLDPLETELPEVDEPVQQDVDIRQMLERATRRVKESYDNGKISSAGAETLLKDLYLLDPAGVIWSYGLHAETWYFFRKDDWQISAHDGPDPADFENKETDSPELCSNCETLLEGGKFCSECGTPAPDSGSPYTKEAREVVERFTESDVAPLPEQIVPEWEPAPGLPGEPPAGSAPAPAAVEKESPPQAQRSPGSEQPAPSSSPQKKRNRIIVLLVVILSVVTCSCCCTLGLVGYFS